MSGSKNGESIDIGHGRQVNNNEITENEKFDNHPVVSK